MAKPGFPYELLCLFLCTWTRDARLLPYRKLDEALVLTAKVGGLLHD